MSDRAQTRAVAGGAGAPLDNLQKRRVCMLAREAWERVGRPGFADQAADTPAEIRLSEREAFDLWRHDQQRAAAGTEHLTCAQNRAYPHMMAHFARLAGREQDADYWAGRTVGDDQRQALAKLRSEQAAARDVIDNPAGYVAAICHSKYKTHDVQTLSPKQVWTLVFDLRRGAQKRRARAGLPF